MSEPARFYRSYALSVVVFAAVIGAGTSLQYLLDQTQAGQAGWVLSSLLRSSAPAASGTALLLGLVLWQSPLSARAVQAGFRGRLGRAAAVAVPGYVLSSAVALAVCFAESALLLGQSWAGFRGWFSVLSVQDLGVGAAGALLDTALIVLLDWRYAARLQAAGSSLPAKLIVVLTVTVPLRATVALIFSSLLSG